MTSVRNKKSWEVIGEKKSHDTGPLKQEKMVTGFMKEKGEGWQEQSGGGPSQSGGRRGGGMV